MLTINQSIPCNIGNYTKCTNRIIKYVVIHYTGNSKDLAVSNAKYFNSNTNCQASAHYFVDDTTIYQSVQDKDKAWHCGTSGKYYHSECRNTNSIGIEMCCTAGNYKVSETTKINAAELCASLCKKYGITIDRVVRHYDVTHKQCPAQMAGDNNIEWQNFKNMIQGYINGSAAQSSTSTTATQNVSYRGIVTADTLNCRKGPSTSYTIVTSYPQGTILQFTYENNGWGYTGTGWVSLSYIKIIKEEEDMTQEKFNEMMDKYLANLAKQPSTWEQSAMDWAQQNNLFHGDENQNLMPKKFLTRGELAAALQKFMQAKG